jgi:hypothetical protein
MIEANELAKIIVKLLGINKIAIEFLFDEAEELIDGEFGRIGEVNGNCYSQMPFIEDGVIGLLPTRSINDINLDFLKKVASDNLDLYVERDCSGGLTLSLSLDIRRSPNSTDSKDTFHLEVVFTKFSGDIVITGSVQEEEREKLGKYQTLYSLMG